jgi:hypothetical protein
MVHKILKSKKLKKYIIIGKRWFDKVNGNTYHSTTVIDVDTNEQVAYSGVVYGYGDSWKQTGYDELKKLGLVKEEDRFNHELNHKRFIYVDAGYHNKRDL